MILKGSIVVMCAHLKENNLYELYIKTVIQEYIIDLKLIKGMAPGKDFLQNR